MESFPMSGAFLVLSVFLASSVEAVEALTIVLATGITRGWRSALFGAAAAGLLLAVITIVGGPAVATLIPLEALRVVIGTLLLIFGMQWLRKAILRASGVKALRDEAAAFEKEVKVLHTDKKITDRIDWTAFTVSFKSVFLEGLEVAFIVITFGGSAKNVPLAALGALGAVLLVIAVGFVVRGPLSRVPENLLKFAVGLMLVAFGTFWSGEGLGVQWPGEDASLIGLVVGYALLSWGLVVLLRSQWASLKAEENLKITEA
jgi:uncharacterized membrane protein